MFYRAIYKPANGSDRENHVDAATPEELPSGAILVVQMNEDGTREIIQDANKKRTLTPKEDRHYQHALRHLEFKHDGGETEEMRVFRKENKT